MREIRENGYDLSINNYKIVEYAEVEYEKPAVMLERIKELEEEIVTGIAELETILKEDN